MLVNTPILEVYWFLLSGVLIIGIAIACPMITEVRKLDLKQNS